MAQGREVVVRRNPCGLDELGEAWDDLLARSDADPLFNSREWLTTWWNQYGPVIGGELDIRQVVAAGELAGLALMSRRQVSHRLGLVAQRLELLGTARGVSGVGFSERTEFILDRNHRGAVAAALATELAADSSWDELVVSYTPEGGATHRAFEEVAAKTGAYLRVADYMEAWEVPLVGGFDSIMDKLGSGTRARILGSRRRLENAGRVEEHLLSADQLENGWELFAEMHQSRWNRRFSDHWRRFYGAITAGQVHRGIPVMSVLHFEGRPISVLVNVRAGRREYSLASMFEPVDVKRVSPGWLHFGLAIERACNDGMAVFDFLGGEGKNEQYKAAFRGHSSRLVCLQLIRSQGLKMFCRGADLMRDWRSRWQQPGNG